MSPQPPHPQDSDRPPTPAAAAESDTSRYAPAIAPTALDQEFEEALRDLESIEAELSYRQAQISLQELLDRLDLTPQEQQGLETEIAGLTQMLHKLDQGVVQIAVFGMVGRGKSSLLNALLGRSVFETGPLHGVTQASARVPWEWHSGAASDVGDGAKDDGVNPPAKVQQADPDPEFIQDREPIQDPEFIQDREPIQDPEPDEWDQLGWDLSPAAIAAESLPRRRDRHLPPALSPNSSFGSHDPKARGEDGWPTARVASAQVGRVELVDTPGLDEIDGEARANLARQVGAGADLILFVIAGDMTQVERQALLELRQVGKPILLVFNKVDRYPDADRQAIYAKVRDDRVRELLSADEIVMAAADPLVAEAIQREDGTVGARLVRGQPQVEALKLKILEVLQREGKALVALNSLLFADAAHERIVARKVAIRDHAANRVIWNATIAKAIAVALNPVTVLDWVGGAAIDTAAILTLSRLYGLSMTQGAALDLLQKIAIASGSLTLGEAAAQLGLSSLKSVLGLSTAATGGATLVPYLSVALTQAGVAGVSSYAIGQITKTYLINGASWGPMGPKAAIARVLETLDEASIVKRIEAELKAKLGPRAWGA